VCTACLQIHGFCSASWQPEVIALATPIVVKDHPIYVLNMSVTTEGGAEYAGVVGKLRTPLMNLATDVRDAITQLP
jgi:hypothetical protein